MLLTKSLARIDLASRTARSPRTLLRLIVLTAYLISSSGCVSTFVGTRQVVPVSSGDVRAEVFLNGIAQGFTPLELTLERNKEHTITVRALGQERTVIVSPKTAGGKVALSAAPLALAAVGVIAVRSLDTDYWGVLVAAIPIGAGAAIGVTSLVVDASTGAFYDLSPAVVEASFP